MLFEIISHIPKSGVSQFIFFCFLFINGIIAYTDLRYKKIPNKLLGIIILFFIINHFFPFGHLSDITFDWAIGILMTFIIGFGIYLLHGWAPGDAKYFIVLSLFLHSSFDMIRFIGNISTLSVVGILGVSLFSAIKRGTGKNIAISNNSSAEKKPKKNAHTIGDFAFFIIPFTGFYLGTIFLREFLYGNNPKFYSLGIDVAVVIFLLLILIRSIQKVLKGLPKNSIKVKFLFLLFSSLPIVYGFITKGVSLWYYIRDIVLFGVPTIIIVSLIIHYGINTLYKQERELKKYSEVLRSEIPLGIIIHKGMIPVKNKGDIFKLSKEHGENLENIQVMVVKSSPFGHYIFASFLLTAFTSFHLAQIVLSKWYTLLSSFWEFFHQWI